MWFDKLIAITFLNPVIVNHRLVEEQAFDLEKSEQSPPTLSKVFGEVISFENGW